MSPRKRRLAMIAVSLALLTAATVFVVNAFRENLVFFYTPSEVIAGKAPSGVSFRIGGLVESGSMKRQADGVTVHFRVTDTAKTLPVSYHGVLPDLFSEGKGAVVTGRLDNGVFVASEVLAKHDENYMPPEAQHAIDAAHKTAKTLK